MAGLSLVLQARPESAEGLRRCPGGQDTCPWTPLFSALAPFPRGLSKALGLGC